MDKKMSVYKCGIFVCFVIFLADFDTAFGKASRCEEIKDFKGGKVFYHGGKYPFVFYLCDDGYSLFPKDVDFSDCKNHQWVPEPPQCLKKCSVPKVMYADMLISTANTSEHGENIRFVCDAGYHFDDGTTNYKTTFETTCHQGEWKEPIPVACHADKCMVPFEFDERLSVKTRRRVSLSAGYIVEIGDFVYFNCSKTSQQIYEPLNRRFKCFNGLWIEAERDPNWKLGNNGTFPTCREAICTPNCTNGGVCYKDDNCRCKHLTEGKQCENFICDKTCKDNGGKCDGPGKCSCPEDRFGLNCAQKGCTIPKDTPTYRGQETIFRPGQTAKDFVCDQDNGFILSSDQGMTCRVNGTWSDVVKCIKGCKPPNNVAKYTGIKQIFGEGETLHNLFCYHGYILSSHNVMECQNDGSWSEIVTCEKGCILPKDVAKHECHKDIYRQGETLNDLFCNDGYFLSSQNGMECRQDGSWSEIVTCEKECTLPNDVANHRDHRKPFRPGERLNGLFCEDGYILSSQNEMVCRQDGSWSEIVTCEKGCLLPNDVAKHRDNRNMFRPGERLNNLFCNHGYILSSKNVMVCRHGGSWSEIVKCEKVCTLPNDVANHRDHRNIFRPGERVNDLYCNKGYILSSTNRMVCQYDGSWSEIVKCEKGHQEVCVPKFDTGHKWKPDWRRLVNEGNIVYAGLKTSARDCQATCIRNKEVSCQSAFYSSIHKECFHIGVSEKTYFTEMHGPLMSRLYIYKQVCQ